MVRMTKLSAREPTNNEAERGGLLASQQRQFKSAFRCPFDVVAINHGHDRFRLNRLNCPCTRVRSPRLRLFNGIIVARISHTIMRTGWAS